MLYFSFWDGFSLVEVSISLLSPVCLLFFCRVLETVDVFVVTEEWRFVGVIVGFFRELVRLYFLYRKSYTYFCFR